MFYLPSLCLKREKIKAHDQHKSVFGEAYIAVTQQFYYFLKNEEMLNIKF